MYTLYCMPGTRATAARPRIAPILLEHLAGLERIVETGVLR